MQIDFSQVDTSVIDRMALFFGIFMLGSFLVPYIVGRVLKSLRMPGFIWRACVGLSAIGWFLYWGMEILSKF